MPRPCICRRIYGQPVAGCFKPQGLPAEQLDEVVLTLDEFEAIRLADLEGLYQQEAAQKMNISRQTFGNIIDSAHKKIADAIVNAKMVRIEGGVVQMMQKHFMCYDCQHQWTVPYGSGRPAECPKCRSSNIHRAPQDRGWDQAPPAGWRRGICRRRGL